MSPSSPEFPPRLAESDDPRAKLIQRALAEPPLGPSEQQSWQRLSARSTRSVPRWLLPSAASALATAAFVAWLAQPTPAPDASLQPEVWAQKPATTAAPQLPSAEEKPAPPARLVAERAKPLPRASAESDATACDKLAKAGTYQAAVTCYGRVARGSSMAAELALYEKARLESKALGERTLALATLDEHARRFPSGVLTTEVGLTRIELLSQLGRQAEALAAIDQGLRGALGRERGGDLQLMRAELLATRGDCASALAALASARQAGVHPARLEATLRRCPADALDQPAPDEQLERP